MGSDRDEENGRPAAHISPRSRSASPGRSRSVSPVKVREENARSPARRADSRSPARLSRSLSPEPPKDRARSRSRERARPKSRSRSRERRRSLSRSRDRGRRSRSRSRERTRNRSRSRDRYGDRDRYRDREPPRGGGSRDGVHMFVAGMKFIVTERDLERKFSKYGRVKEARIVRGPTGESRGFGFVVMTRPDEVDDAIREMNGRDWDGRRLLVERARNVRT